MHNTPNLRGGGCGTSQQCGVKLLGKNSQRDGVPRGLLKGGGGAGVGPQMMSVSGPGVGAAAQSVHVLHGGCGSGVQFSSPPLVIYVAFGEMFLNMSESSSVFGLGKGSVTQCPWKGHQHNSNIMCRWDSPVKAASDRVPVPVPWSKACPGAGAEENRCWTKGTHPSAQRRLPSVI